MLPSGVGDNVFVCHTVVRKITHKIWSMWDQIKSAERHLPHIHLNCWDIADNPIKRLSLITISSYLF
jgi:hypothetical protein